MKKADLKQIIKPLVKECIHEVLLEEGLLSNVVAEVAKGLQQNVIVESQPRARRAPAPQQRKSSKPPPQQRKNSESTQKINQYRQSLMDSIGNDAYNGVNLFEGTTPLSGAPPKPGAAPAPQGPLAGVAPSDAGVDISNLLGAAGRNWKTLAGSGK